ncbi:homoserine acetyltransferase [Punctularia strigosozonata HHB-11173 SS5]|uniref:homoserine acetyltransferase n=1 Tax=Punctularia strigosozonata (strain HHB-11173) TaxID=741275 RepID=UPI000441669D|nr:homoserine acetyltransferase [Punctularia strigosozonata HHB-11173 SS5]EIN10860.1 homoserine acetyltransferase [Punctularia strigosozonata HHB-11173 SS5]
MKLASSGLARIPLRAGQKLRETRASSSLSSLSERPVFPCVDAHAARESRLRASGSQKPPAPTTSTTWHDHCQTIPRASSSKQQPSFACVHAHTHREPRIASSPKLTVPSRRGSDPESGPEPPYARPNPTSYHIYHHDEPLQLTYSSSLPSFDLAYETWGILSPNKDNVILLHTGLSASSHAASTSVNSSPGWWEKFIGPGLALDTDRFFVICCNVLGGCYGSTGPSSIDPTSRSGEPYATRFPILSIFDMVRAQFCLLDFLGVDKLYASVGSSMGGMQSLAAGWLYPERVGKIVSISGTARSSPGSIAMRYAQRSVLMADPNWNNGFYYDKLPPHTGMKLARQIATITYRSGPEWDLRFGRKLRPLPVKANEPSEVSRIRKPALCPDFLIETYLDHQGEEFCLKYDANSLIYISKAMDLFDLTASSLQSLNMHLKPAPTSDAASSSLAFPSKPPHRTSHSKSHPPPPNPPPYLSDLAQGLAPLAHTPTLILGVQSDILFPVEQQREMADALRLAGNQRVSYYELGGVWGHDTFLLDVQNVGGAVRGFL